MKKIPNYQIIFLLVSTLMCHPADLFVVRVVYYVRDAVLYPRSLIVPWGIPAQGANINANLLVYKAPGNVWHMLHSSDFLTLFRQWCCRNVPQIRSALLWGCRSSSTNSKNNINAQYARTIYIQMHTNRSMLSTHKLCTLCALEQMNIFMCCSYLLSAVLVPCAIFVCCA